MKQTWRYLIVFLVLTAFGTTNLLAKNYDFKLRLKKGDHLEYIFTSTDKVDQKINNLPVLVNQKSSFTFVLSVVDKLKDGNYQVAVDYKRFATSILVEGHSSSYDSDSISTYHSNQIADLLNNFTKIHLTCELSPLGVVSKLSGLEDLTKKISTDMRLTNILKGIGTTEFIGQLLSYLPKGKVEPGAKWVVHTTLPELNKLEYDADYTFTNATKDQVKFNFQSKFGYVQPKPVINGARELEMKENGIQNGSVVLDPKTKMPIASGLKQEIDVVVTHTDEKTMTKTITPMKIYTTNSLKLVKSK